MPKLEGNQQVNVPPILLLVGLVFRHDLLDVFLVEVSMQCRAFVEQAFANVLAHAAPQPFIDWIRKSLLFPVHDFLGQPMLGGLLV